MRPPITVDLMVNDTVSLLQLLRDRFDKNPYVAGFSLGATIGAYAAARRPDLVAKLVAVGTDIDGVAAANSAYDFALSTARQRANKRAIRQLEAIGPPPHLDAKQFAIRVRWASNFGGVTTTETYAAVVRGLLASLLRSPDYAPRDVLRTVRGITATQSALLPELAALDLGAYPASPPDADRHGPRPTGPGGARRRRPAVFRLARGYQQATDVVREVGSYPPPRGAPEIPGTPQASSSRPTRRDLNCHSQDRHPRQSQKTDTTQTEHRSVEMPQNLSLNREGRGLS